MRIIVGVLLLLGGLIGLAMTACGGIVTFLAIGDKNMGGTQLWAISVPSLLGGLLLLRVVKKQLERWRSSDAGPTPPPPFPPA